MNIGIVTLNGNFNYGNRLQLFAVCQIYRDLGAEPTVLIPELRHDRAKEALQGVKDRIKRIIGRPVVSPFPEDSMSKERLAAFKAFSGLMPARTIATADQPTLGQDYDYFSVGSDQVWNPELIRGYEDWYFLKFAPSDRRIALAPSIGLSQLDANQAQVLRKGVDGFDRISVRETQGANLIKEYCDRDADVIVDPTLALPADRWREIAKDALTPSSPYVFVYLLGGSNEQSDAAIAQATRHSQLPAVTLSDREKSGELPAGPAEFIDLIDHATHVVTDSFHASVFAMLMGTPLTIVRRTGSSADMFSRLQNLADTFGLKDKVYGSSSFAFDSAGDYPQSMARLTQERERFLGFIRSCIHGL